MPDMTDEQLRKTPRAARDPVTGKSITVPGDMSYREWYGKFVENRKDVANPAGDGIIESQGGGDAVIHSIDFPIEQRNTSRGKPGAILHYDVSLNNRQQQILDQLPEYNSRVTVPKDEVSMTDLSALTAKTGDEFAMFTKQGERLVIRGNAVKVDVSLEDARKMTQDGYTWSGHTHPGADMNVLQPSAGDYAILNQFRQDKSAIYNSVGEYLIFERSEPYV